MGIFFGFSSSNFTVKGHILSTADMLLGPLSTLVVLAQITLILQMQIFILNFFLKD